LTIIDIARFWDDFDEEHFEVLSKFAAMCTRADKELAVKENMFEKSKFE